MYHIIINTLLTPNNNSFLKPNSTRNSYRHLTLQSLGQFVYSHNHMCFWNFEHITNFARVALMHPQRL